MWTSEEWRMVNDIQERLARLETAVENHLPTRLAALERSVNIVHARMWAIVFGILLTGIGVWLNYSILKARVL